MYSVIFLFLIQYKIINHGIKSMLINGRIIIGEQKIIATLTCSVDYLKE